MKKVGRKPMGLAKSFSISLTKKQLRWLQSKIKTEQSISSALRSILQELIDKECAK